MDLKVTSVDQGFDRRMFRGLGGDLALPAGAQEKPLATGEWHSDRLGCCVLDVHTAEDPNRFPPHRGLLEPNAGSELFWPTQAQASTMVFASRPCAPGAPGAPCVPCVPGATCPPTAIPRRIPPHAMEDRDA